MSSVAASLENIADDLYWAIVAGYGLNLSLEGPEPTSGTYDVLTIMIMNVVICCQRSFQFIRSIGLFCHKFTSIFYYVRNPKKIGHSGFCKTGARDRLRKYVLQVARLPLSR